MRRENELTTLTPYVCCESPFRVAVFMLLVIWYHPVCLRMLYDGFLLLLVTGNSYEHIQNNTKQARRPTVKNLFHFERLFYIIRFSSNILILQMFL